MNTTGSRPRPGPSRWLTQPREGAIRRSPPSATRRRRRHDWPTRRNPGDALRILGGLVVLGLASVGAHAARPTVVETNLFRLINELPAPLNSPLLGAMQLGALAAVPVFAAWAFLAHRRRLAVLTLAAGTAAWGATKLIQLLVDEESPQVRLPRVLVHGSSSPGLAFPASHVAVAAALATVAAPYLGRSARRTSWLLVVLVAVARIYVGLHLPIDVIGGLAVGWAVGAAVNLLAGVPAASPSPAHLAAVLGELGLEVRSIDPLHPDGDPVRCATSGGSVLAKTIDWGRPEHDWLYRTWRLVAFRELDAPVLPGSPQHRADHEAYLALLAERAGVRTPSVLATRRLGEHACLLVRRWVEGQPLPTGPLPDQVLIDAWRQLQATHAAGIVHRNVRPDHLLVEPDGGVWLIGWGSAEAGTDPDDRAADLAEMLVTLASRAGPERAVRTGIDVLGPAALSETLGHLQPLALASDLRRLVATEPALLTSLRAEVAAIDGREPPVIQSLTRVAVTNLFPVAAAAAAMYALLPRLAKSTTGLSDLRTGHVPWLVAAAGAAALTYLMASVALIVASGRPLAVGRTFAVQLAAACTNRVIPAGMGAAAVNIRYLELNGVEAPAATATITVIAGVGFAVHLVGSVAVLALLHRHGPSLHVPTIDPDWPFVAVVLALAAAVGWAIGVHQLHRPVIAWVRAAAGDLRAAFTDPGRISRIAVASAGINACYILALAAALRAFDVRLGMGPVAAVYLGGSAVAAVAPTPGGVGPFEAAAVAALTAYGVAGGPAVAAVIAYRLITYWLPVIPGAVCLRRLRRAAAL